MTLVKEIDKGPISESKKSCFFANISRYDCPIYSLFEKSTFPHHFNVVSVTWGEARTGFKGKLWDHKYVSKI